MEWISVGERLPGEDEFWVFVWDGTYRRMAMHDEYGEWESFEGYDLDPRKAETIVGVTHWMPLPKPPA